MIPLLLIQITNGATPVFKAEWCANSNAYIGPSIAQPVTK